MPDFRINSLYTSMGGAIGPQDHKLKPQDQWTAYDWLNAVNDTLNVTGKDAGTRERIEGIRSVMGCIEDFRSRMPGLTEQQLAACFGRRFRNLQHEIADLGALPQGSLTDAERAILYGALAAMPETDTEEYLRAAEQAEAAERYSLEADDYMFRMLALAADEQSKGPAADPQVTESLISRAYIARHLSKNARQNISRGYPSGFRADMAEDLSRSLLNDRAYRSCIDGYADFPLPQGQYPAERERTALLEYVEGVDAAVRSGFENNPLEYDTGGPALAPELVPRRLAVLREAARSMESAGTGGSILPLMQSDEERQEYRDLMAEIERQIYRLENGLPAGRNDDFGMLARLDAYTAGKEAGTLSGQDSARLQSCLRLYSEYTSHPAPHAPADEQSYPHPADVQKRFNRARNVQNDPGSADYVDLSSDRYVFDARSNVNGAAAAYDRLIADLRQLHSVRVSGGKLTDSRRMQMEDIIRRLHALHTLMINDRAGIFAENSEAALQQIMAREHDSIAVFSAVGIANRDAASMQEITGVFADADHAAANAMRFASPDTFSDPLDRDIMPFTFRTVQQHLDLAFTELGEVTIGIGSEPMEESAAAEFARLAGRILALRSIAERSSGDTSVRVGEDMIAGARNSLSRYTYLDAAVRNCAGCSSLGIELIGALRSGLPMADIYDMLDRFAVGHIRDMTERAVAEVLNAPSDTPVTGQNEAEETLVRIAGLYSLRDDPYAAMPGHEFGSTDMFTNREMEAAEQNVRQDLRFMEQAGSREIEDFGQLGDIVRSMAAFRMDAVTKEADAETARVTQAQTERQREIMRRTCERRLIRLIAIRNLQRSAGNICAVITDEQILQEEQIVRQSGEFLAADRATGWDFRNIISISECFRVRGQALDEALGELPRELYREASPAGSYGDMDTRLNRFLTAENMDFGDPADRAVTADHLLMILANRRAAMQSEGGCNAQSDMDMYAKAQQEISSDPVIAGLIMNVQNDPEAAESIFGILTSAMPLYTVTARHERAALRGEPFTDPLFSSLSGSVPDGASEVLESSRRAIAGIADGAEPGFPLSERERGMLLDSAAGMAAAKALGAGEPGVSGSVPETDLIEKKAELKNGATLGSVNLLNAVGRAGLNGLDTGELIGIFDAPYGSLGSALADYSMLTPEQWAGKDLAALQVFDADEGHGSYAPDEMEAFCSAYARYHVMSMAAKDPASASERISAAEVVRQAEAWLDSHGQMLRSTITYPAGFMERSTIGGQLEAMYARVTYTDAGMKSKVRDILAMNALQNRYFPGAIADRSELLRETEEIGRSFAFRVISDSSGAVKISEDIFSLRGKDFTDAVEDLVYNSPVRESLVLNGADADSLRGRILLMADEIRHDSALGRDENRDLRTAQLYLLSQFETQGISGSGAPSRGQAAALAEKLMGCEDFRDAMRTMGKSPAKAEKFLREIRQGADPASLTAELDGLADAERKTMHPEGYRRSDIAYAVRRIYIDSAIDGCGEAAGGRWPRHGAGSFAECRDAYIRLLALHCLYASDGGRLCFTEQEIAAKTREILARPDIRQDLQRMSESPEKFRSLISGSGPYRFWKGMDELESSGRSAVCAGGAERDTGKAARGLSSLCDTLAEVIAIKLCGAGGSLALLATAGQHSAAGEERYSDNMTAIENALRQDVDGLDRIRKTLMLPDSGFAEAYDRLAEDCRKSFPEVPVEDPRSVGYRYASAMDRISSADPYAVADNRTARRRLAADIMEVLALRGAVIGGERGEGTWRGRVNEYTDARSLDADSGIASLQTAAGDLEEIFRDPGKAQSFIRSAAGSRSLRSLIRSSIEAGNGFADPLVKELFGAGMRETYAAEPETAGKDTATEEAADAEDAAKPQDVMSVQPEAQAEVRAGDSAEEVPQAEEQAGASFEEDLGQIVARLQKARDELYRDVTMIQNGSSEEQDLHEEQTDVQPQPEDQTGPEPQQDGMSAGTPGRAQEGAAVRVVPDISEKNTVFGSFQRSVAQLENGIRTRTESGLPFSDDRFLSAAEETIIRTMALHRLAAEKDPSKAGGAGMSSEIGNVRRDLEGTELREALKQEEAAQTILEGFKRLGRMSPAVMLQHVKNTVSDWKRAAQALEEAMPGPETRYVAPPTLPRTVVKNDRLHASDGEAELSPVSVYTEMVRQVKKYHENAAEQSKSPAEAYNSFLWTGFTNLYAIRMVIAESEDPAAEDPDLRAKMEEKVRMLSRDEGFMNSIRLCGQSADLTPRLIREFESNMSFSSLTAVLDDCADRAYRLEVSNGLKKPQAQKQGQAT